MDIIFPNPSLVLFHLAYVFIDGNGPIIRRPDRATIDVVLENKEIEFILKDEETGTGVKKTPAYE